MNKVEVVGGGGGGSLDVVELDVEKVGKSSGVANKVVASHSVTCTPRASPEVDPFSKAAVFESSNDVCDGCCCC